MFAKAFGLACHWTIVVAGLSMWLCLIVTRKNFIILIVCLVDQKRLKNDNFAIFFEALFNIVVKAIILRDWCKAFARNLMHAYLLIRLWTLIVTFLQVESQGTAFFMCAFGMTTVAIWATVTLDRWLSWTWTFLTKKLLALRSAERIRFE